MSPPPLIVVFGAAVRPDGSPSEALLRRIAGARLAAEAHPGAPILCSGGAGPVGPSEAALIAQHLAAAGVAPQRLILDETSFSTRDNVEAAVRRVRAGGHPRVIACSDAYHLGRIRLLLRLAGVASEPGPAAAGAPLGHHLAMSLREAAAIVHNLASVLARPRRQSDRAS